MASELVTQVSQDDEKARRSQKKEDRSCCWCCFGRPAETPQKNVPQQQQNANVSNYGGSSNADSIPKLLGDPEPNQKKTLVLDLDETLVHSSFKPINDADFKIEIELEATIHRVYVRKRPGVDEFLRDVAKKWEVVIFTASLAKYADPLLDILDSDRISKARLFRESCVQHYGNYVKDLSHLGRRLEDCVIIDNSPFSYMFQPNNAIPITSWFNDQEDRQLYDLLPFLDSLLEVDDVSTILQRKNFSFLDPRNSDD